MSLLIAFVLATGAASAATASVPAPSFVQATIVSAEAAAARLSFVDPSGRTRSHRVSPTIAARLDRWRPGEAVIVRLAGDVVEGVRLARVAAPVATEPSAAPEGAPLVVVSARQARPSWPNPYSRYYHGPRPAPPRPMR